MFGGGNRLQPSVYPKLPQRFQAASCGGLPLDARPAWKSRRHYASSHISAKRPSLRVFFWPRRGQSRQLRRRGAGPLVTARSLSSRGRQHSRCEFSQNFRDRSALNLNLVGAIVEGLRCRYRKAGHETCSYCRCPRAFDWCPRRSASRFDWLEKYGTSETQIAGATKVTDVERFNLPELTIGPIVLENVIVIVPGEGEVTNVGKGVKAKLGTRIKETSSDGILGYDVLKHFIVTIDYRHSLLHLGLPAEN